MPIRTIAPGPEAPSQASPGTFASLAEVFLAWLSTTLPGELNNTVSDMNAFATELGSLSSVIMNGTGAPESGLGVNGNYYIATDTGDLYYKASGAWTLKGNLKGPAGSSNTAEVTRLENQIILLALRQATAASAASAALIEGYEWPFPTDILATKTNATYDASGMYYGNPSFYTTFAATLSSSDAGSGTAITFRQLIPAALIATSGSKFRVTLKATAAEALAVSNMFVGKKASSGNAWDFDGNQIRVTFSGANNVTVPVGGTAVSDWMAFSIDETAAYIFALDLSGGSSDDKAYATGQTGAQLYYKASSGEASITAPSGYTTWPTANAVAFVTSVEVQAAALNMTLAPSAVTAAAHPDDVSLFILHKAVDALTMGVDIKVRVSTNGGTNWTALETDFVFLADYSADYKLYRADLDTSALTGTGIVWEITTYNTKQQRVRAVAAIWG